MNHKIAVVGLGYVGLPLLVEFSNKFSVKGIDVDKEKIKKLRNFHDYTGDLTQNEIQNLKNIFLTSNFDEIKDCNTYIVTVPTPINEDKSPNLSFLKNVTKSLGSIL